MKSRGRTGNDDLAVCLYGESLACVVAMKEPSPLIDIRDHLAIMIRTEAGSQIARETVESQGDVIVLGQFSERRSPDVSCRSDHKDTVGAIDGPNAHGRSARVIAGKISHQLSGAVRTK